MVTIKRWIKNSILPPWYWRTKFPKEALREIENAIFSSEQKHSAELRVAIENSLPTALLWDGVSINQRAMELFSRLRIWDTEENCGVLIYILLAEREVHILADRGIARKVEQAAWQEIIDAIRRKFACGDYLSGTLQGIERISDLLAKYYPPSKQKTNQLPNQAVIIRR